MTAQRFTGPGVICAADIIARRVEFLWEGRIPKGKPSILEGDPKLGKSTVALDLGARISSGAPMPGSSLAHPPGRVLIMTAEDGLDDTVKPRLILAQACMENIGIWKVVPQHDEDGRLRPDRGPSLPQDVLLLEQIIRDNEAVFVIIDVLNSFLGPGIDGYRDLDIRRALAPVAARWLDRKGRGGGAAPVFI